MIPLIIYKAVSNKDEELIYDHPPLRDQEFMIRADVPIRGRPTSQLVIVLITIQVIKRGQRDAPLPPIILGIYTR